MPYGLYLSAEGAHAQSQRLEVLANNLANVDTPGFKRDLAVLQARLAESTARGEDAPGSRSLNDIGGGVVVRETRTDFSPGVLKFTNNEKDFAINGDGFFVVNRAGQNLLTRAGNFLINAANQLATQQGDPVMSDGNSPITIDPSLPWTLTPEGSILQAGNVQPLALVKPNSLGDLAKVGENYFRPLAAPQAVESSERRVAQRFLEGSGVKPTLEMMELIETTRAFEANTNMIRTQDQAMGGLINRILKES